MVGDAALRKIVGADALGAVARADLAAPLRRAFGIELAALLVVELGPQHPHRLSAILVLRPLLLHVNDDAARKMGDADRRLRLVDMLAAGAARAHRVDLEVVF